jgi:hypothetical protein
MGSTDLTRLERRARVAYEVARLRMAVTGVAPVVALVALAVLVGNRPAWAFAFGSATVVLGLGMLWYGRDAQRAVLPGIAAGFVPLALALTANHWHACGPNGCVSFCVPACSVGGLIAGVSVAVVGTRRRAGLGFWGSASGLALLTGAMGCSCVGSAGVVGLAIGFAAGTLPALVRRALVNDANG